MGQGLAVFWNRCADDTWADLNAVDLDDPHFDGFEGVYVVWHGGTRPEVVCVGQGVIRERLAAHRADPAVQAYKAHTLFATWARVERPARAGAERFLLEATRPKLAAPLPAEPPLEINLPGKEPPAGLAPAAPEPTRPKHIWRDMATLEDPSQLKSNAVNMAEPPKPPPPPVETPKPAPAPTPVPTPAPKVRRLSRLQTAFDELLAERAKAPKSSGFFGGQQKPKEEDTLAPQVVQLILAEAVKLGASDIHCEPQQELLRVRFRIDGILDEVLVVPHSANIRVVSYIRVACALDPEKSVGTAKPEDGRMAVTVEGKEADLRLSTFPTPNGDKAVLRIIPRNVTVPQLRELGLREETVRLLDNLIRRPQGMFIVTGPTGSGKSTTLYTALQTLNEASRNIVTLEDPIEKKIPGITQGAIQAKVGFTFASGLRAILRQDPNIVMVGEIRDTETAEIALSAALTGHMLFTTLHTNSALGAITRLLDMGLEAFLIASALTAVSAQRLARKLCAGCREAYEPEKPELAQVQALAERAGIPFKPEAYQQAFRAKGCETCRYTGYAGRLLLFEIVRNSPTLRQQILRKASLDEMRAAALKDGSEILLIDGLKKVADGLTTFDELTRVVGAEE